MPTILFLGASPKGEMRLALGNEVREVSLRLRGSTRGRAVTLAQEWAVRPRDVQACVMRHEPCVVHFSGHGTREGALIFEDDAGKAAPIAGSAIADLFGIIGETVRLVVLNACYSADQAELISRHVDCVVGMSAAVKDKAAIAFSTAFYEALAGFGKSVEVAFKLGKNEIDLESLGQADVPHLLCKDGVKADKLRLFST